MNNSSIIIVDSSSWFYQLVYRMPSLSIEDQETGIIFGMMNKIISHAKKLNSNKFIFIFDSKKSKRKKIFPEYKIKRNKEKRTQEEKQILKESFLQLNDFRINVLPKLGFKNIFIQTGYEADDLIASLIKNNTNEYFIIISSDNDLYQLLSDNVKIYNTKTEKFYTNIDFNKEYNLSPSEWVDVKKWGGCKSDCVPGPAEGYKIKTAIKFIKKQLSRDNEIYKIFVSEEGRKIAERNEKLVKLPFEGTEVFDINENWKLDMKNFIYICDKYQFLSLLRGDAYEKWQTIMCGE